MRGNQLVLDSLSMLYPGAEHLAVDHVSLEVGDGEFVTLLGPSGCGKTTTLRLVAGLQVPTSGRIVTAGRDITGVPVHKRGMGMVFQSYALFPHLKVGQNVAFGLEMRGIAKPDRRSRVRAALEMVQLGGYENRRVRQLSGGQQQRVALARALVIQPQVLLLDEPLSNLDANLRQQMRVEIRRIQRQTAITTLFVTHDQAEALTMSDRVAVLNDGHLEQVGSPTEVYEWPKSRFVAEFVGQSNLFDGVVVSSGSGVTTVDVAGLGKCGARGVAQVGEETTVMIRPHRVSLSTGADAESASKRGVVEDVVYVGDRVQYLLRIGDTPMSAEQVASGSGTFSRGDEIGVSWRPDDALVIGADRDEARAQPATEAATGRG